MLMHYVLAWFPMLCLAILNGAAREKLYGPYMSERAAHQLSCIVGMGLFTVYTVVLSPYLPLESSSQALMGGLIWLVLTVVFEFSMVCLMQRRPLSAALADYNLRAGRLWPLVLLWVGALPWFVLTVAG